MSRRVGVTLDELQGAWVDALAELYGCSQSAVLREGLRWLAARETVRLERSERYAQIAAAARAAEPDPMGEFVDGRWVRPRRLNA